MTRKLKLVLVTVVCLLFVAGGFFVVLAQEIDPNKVTGRRAQLEAELAGLEVEIENQRTLIQSKQREASSFERDIAIIDAEINKIKLELRARNLSISELSGGIEERTRLITDFETQIDDGKTSLAELLRRVEEMDSTSIVEILLGYDTLSEFFEDFSSFESIQKELQVSLISVKETQTKTSDEKQILEEKKAEELELRYIQELEKSKSLDKEKEKQRLLDATKGEEAKYQKILSMNQKSAAAIRSELFMLTGSPSIPFEKAVEYASAALSATGVSPAFLLAIITQETNLGANIGQCLLTNIPQKGDGKGKNTGTFFSGIMKPTRDVDPFMRITAALGLDSTQMPVSCPQPGGYGGAMGPAQFIPSTWEGYEKRIASLTGHNPPNPWDPYDAFMASALYLKDLGAAAGGYTAERTAALKYFAGSNWKKLSYAFYGDDVMEITAKYQKQIDIISQ